MPSAAAVRRLRATRWTRPAPPPRPVARGGARRTGECPETTVARAAARDCGTNCDSAETSSVPIVTRQRSRPKAHVRARTIKGASSPANARGLRATLTSLVAHRTQPARCSSGPRLPYPQHRHREHSYAADPRTQSGPERPAPHRLGAHIVDADPTTCCSSTKRSSMAFLVQMGLPLSSDDVVVDVVGKRR